jgi:hypothetical protein
MLDQAERDPRPHSEALDVAAADEARRFALRAIGRYVGYTAPAILSLLVASDAAAGPRLSVAPREHHRGRRRGDSDDAEDRD